MARDKSATIDLKVRMKEPLRAKIESAAGARGVSLNAEAVDRLEKSFADQEARYEGFGGPGGYGIFRVLGSAASALGTAIGKTDWWRDPRSFAKVRDLSSSLLKVLQKEIAESDGESRGTTLHWRLKLEVAESTEDGGKGEYRLASMHISRVEL